MLGGPTYYQWLLHGAPLSGAIGPASELRKVARSDTGVYTLVVSNMFGSTANSDASLTVTSPMQLALLAASTAAFQLQAT